MGIKDAKCAKSTCEKYTFSFNKGWDWAIFTIDEHGLFQCHSSYGDYNHYWGSHGGNFKKFLCTINSGYLLDKVAKEDTFDFEDYIKDTKKEILEMRREESLTSEQARELWDYFNSDMDNFEYTSSLDLVAYEVVGNKTLNKIYRGSVYDSRFMPRKTYSNQALLFAREVYPLFVEELRKELEG